MRKESIRNRMKFNDIAHLYDKFRPGYPKRLFIDVINRTKLHRRRRILEIGSGTGKATEILLKLNFKIRCIDISVAMSEILRNKFRNNCNLKIDISSFENWLPEGENFDLIFSAQAFHWIPTEISYKKAASLLVDKGYLALFWNTNDPPESDFEIKLHDIYRNIAPQILEEKRPLGEEFVRKQVAEISCSKYFVNIFVNRYYWKKSYTCADYLDLLNTYSDHIALNNTVRRQLYGSIQTLFKQYGGQYTIAYKTVLFLAQKSKN